jgi:hypothetical protein
MDQDETLGLPRQGGRKSAASLAVVPIASSAVPLQPPSRLTADESAVWRETVASVKPGWFRGSETVLETFCRAVVVERRLAARLHQLDPADERFGGVARTHRAEAMLVGNLAGKLRLTVRATLDRETTKSGVAPASYYDLMALQQGDADAQN